MLPAMQPEVVAQPVEDGGEIVGHGKIKRPRKAQATSVVRRN